MLHVTVKVLDPALVLDATEAGFAVGVWQTGAATLLTVTVWLLVPNVAVPLAIDKVQVIGFAAVGALKVMFCVPFPAKVSGEAEVTVDPLVPTLQV